MLPYGDGCIFLRQCSCFVKISPALLCTQGLQGFHGSLSALGNSGSDAIGNIDGRTRDSKSPKKKLSGFSGDEDRRFEHNATLPNYRMLKFLGTLWWQYDTIQPIH